MDNRVFVDRSLIVLGNSWVLNVEDVQDLGHLVE